MKIIDRLHFELTFQKKEKLAKSCLKGTINFFVSFK